MLKELARRIRPRPESVELKRETFVVSVDELAEANPQIAVYNTVSYKDMETAFAPELFDPLQLAKVEVEVKGKRKIHWGIVDGHTKLKFAQEQGHKHGIDEVKAYDSTKALLNNARIVPEEERDGRNVLTITQYLRAVIEPTRVHRDIAPRRIAAHFINGWEAMVGRELSEQLSATAALSLLADPRLPNATDELLKRSLREREILLVNETPDQREALESALRRLNSIVRRAQMRPGEVHREAFLIIATADPIIGGREQAYAELHGMLNIPAVHSKIEKFVPDDIVSQKQAQDRLHQTVLKTLESFSDEVALGANVPLISDILQDTELTFQQTLEILESDDTEKHYNSLKGGIRLARLAEIYSEQVEDKEISESEKLWLERFSQINLRHDDYPKVTEIVQRAATTSNNTEQLLNQLRYKKEDFEVRGISKETIESAKSTLTGMLSHFQDAQSHHQLNTRERELNSQYQETLLQFRADELTHQANSILDEYLMSHLEKAFGKDVSQSLRPNVLAFLINLGEDLFDKERVSVLLNDMTRLDNDLLLNVIDDEATLGGAVELQQERLADSQPLAEIEGDPELLRARDVEYRNSQLYQSLQNIHVELSLSELKPDDLSDDNLELALDVIDMLVKAVSSHPQLKMKLEKDYPHLMKQITNLLEDETEQLQ